MTYIANRPVRFDRDYAIGEIIPDSVIDPQMIRKLIGMGRIIRIADTQKPESQAEPAESESAEHETGPAEHAESPESGGNGEGGTNTRMEEKTASEGELDSTGGTAEAEVERTAEPAEYRCAVCGKTYASANALAAHSRVHKK